MIPDRQLNIIVNNDYSHINYEEEYYYGTFHILITSSTNTQPQAYFIISKFHNYDKPLINRVNHSDTDININMLWNNNETPKLYLNNNPQNIAFMLQIKIFSML